jgi:hypothetical protein
MPIPCVRQSHFWGRLRFLLIGSVLGFFWPESSGSTNPVIWSRLRCDTSVSFTV